jgi:hypothetical protein
MILYVNGDSHSVGHGTAHSAGMCFNDAELQPLGEAPHPANLPHSYGALLAQQLNVNLVCQALSGGSLDRAIRTTKTFLYQNQGPVFVLLGVPSWERTEKFYHYSWWPINYTGHEHLPAGLHKWYKNWILEWERGSMRYYHDQPHIHQQLIEFHAWLDQHQVPHLFFNTAQSFVIDGRFQEHDWQGAFVTPYGDHTTPTHYLNWCRSQGYVDDEYGHYGKDAHVAWANYLLPHIQSRL